MTNARTHTSVPAGPGSAYRVILEPSEDGDRIWTAEIPALGIVTEGRGRAGAERAAINAVRGYRTTAERNGKDVPAADLQVTIMPGTGWRSRTALNAEPGTGRRRKYAGKKTTARKAGGVSKKSKAKKSGMRAARVSARTRRRRS